jgi:5-methylcytosine-specific restriction endonuclease McrA
MTDLKVCPSCKETFPREHFGTRRAQSGNLVSRSYCQECSRRKGRERYDPVKAKAHYEVYKVTHAEQLIKSRKKSIEKNREKRLEDTRKWREKNKDRVLEYSREYKAKNRQAASVWERARQARKRNASTVKFTKEQLHLRLSMFAGCWMCGGPKESVDHVKPLSKGGAHILSNLRPSCKSCNSRKRNKWPLPDILLSA